MKLVYPICCGVDVHKKSLVATIVTTDKEGISIYQQRTFSTINSDIERFHCWLIENNCYHVCMESTGKYWIPIFNVLESDIQVILTHPKYVSAIKGKKTDKKDSKWIADLFKFDMVRNSFIPPKDIRALREIARYRFKLVCMKASEKNRIQNCMTVSNIAIASILSDPFGVTATQIISYLLSTNSPNEEVCRKLIKGQAKKKADLIIDSIQGFKIESDQALKMTLARGHLDYLEQMVVNTEVELFVRIIPYMPLVKLLAELPGITELSATLILAEIGADMSVFEDADHMASWAGLTPANNESAGKKKSVRISHAGQYIKPLMVQCALAATKSKKEPYFSIKYEKLKKRRGHKKAIIAIARMMLVCIYHMLSNGETFNPSDYEELKNPHNHQPKVVLTLENALNFIAQQGIDISVLELSCNES